MKVIFLKNIPGAGQRGAVKEVADGYARNFLLPRGFARAATDLAVQRLDDEARETKKLSEENLRETQKLASKIDGAVVELQEKVSPEGTLYAAVGQKKISAALKKKLGTVISEDWLSLRKPIKECGEFEVRARLPHGLEADITVLVTER